MKIQISKKSTFKLILTTIGAGILFTLGFFANDLTLKNQSGELINPFVDSGQQISYPLLEYTIPNLQKREYKTSDIILEKVLTEEDSFTSFLFSYQTMGRKMTGQINIPDRVTSNPEQKNNLVVMLRGYVPAEIYTTGVGTKNAAAVFAKAGYITIAPDFFGYGNSDPEPEDSWATRFEKPIAVIELIKSLETNGVPLEVNSELEKTKTIKIPKTKIANYGIWAHSNGGQIALTTLEILRKPIPTTLWAPVTAPFPYSVAYFSDELEDEGKSQRKWIAMFEENYDVFDFSHTQHLNSLTGPIQIQHGDSDDAALIYWSQEFVDKIEKENLRREKVNQEKKELVSTTSARQASASANLTGDNDKNTSPILDPVEINLITYPNTNHNLVPSWDKAVQKDLQFFDKWL